jgi:hypothetical protein
MTRQRDIGMLGPWKGGRWLTEVVGWMVAAILGAVGVALAACC